MFDAVPVEMIPSVEEMKESGKMDMAVVKRDSIKPEKNVRSRSVFGVKGRKGSIKIAPAGVKVEPPVDAEEFKRAVARRGSFIM